MATQRTSFMKLQRERDRQARAMAKRDRRQGGGAPEEPAAEAPAGPLPETLSAAQLLQMVERVHKQYEAGEIGFEEFEEAKQDLLSRLPVE